ERVQLVQGSVRTELADRTPRVNRCDQRSRHRGRQARDGGDDDDEEDRHRQDRGGAAWRGSRGSLSVCGFPGTGSVPGNRNRIDEERRGQRQSSAGATASLFNALSSINRLSPGGWTVSLHTAGSWLRPGVSSGP